MVLMLPNDNVGRLLYSMELRGWYELMMKGLMIASLVTFP